MEHGTGSNDLRRGIAIRCNVQIAKLPAALGDVNSVMQGNFISGRTSFLVHSQKGYTACAARKNQISVVCQPIKAHMPVGVSMAPKVLAGGIDVLQFTGSPDAKSKNSDELHRDVAQFSAGLNSAIRILKIKINQPPMHQSWGCDYDDDLPQKSNCDTDDDGPGGGWDWNPGGYDTKYRCTVGPIPICTIIGTPPPPAYPEDGRLPPMGPATPTICGITGFFCASPSEPLLPPAETVEERKQGCDRKYGRDMDECQAYSRAMDYRSFSACKERASQYYADCLTAAERP